MNKFEISENKKLLLLIVPIYITCIPLFWPLMTVLAWSAAIQKTTLSEYLLATLSYENSGSWN